MEAKFSALESSFSVIEGWNSHTSKHINECLLALEAIEPFQNAGDVFPLVFSRANNDGVVNFIQDLLADYTNFGLR